MDGIKVEKKALHALLVCVAAKQPAAKQLSFAAAKQLRPSSQLPSSFLGCPYFLHFGLCLGGHFCEL